MRAVLREPSIHDDFIRLGLMPVDSPGVEELTKFLRSEIARSAGIVRAVGLAGVEQTRE
jgi:hypothetical protein